MAKKSDKSIRADFVPPEDRPTVDLARLDYQPAKAELGACAVEKQ